MTDDIRTIADTIIWLAKQRITKTGFAGAVCAVCMDIDKILMEAMAQDQAKGLTNGSKGA